MSSGSSDSPSSTAASSSSPTSGEICSNRGLRARSAPRQRALLGVGHRLVGGVALLDVGRRVGVSESGRPPPGRSLFPGRRLRPSSRPNTSSQISVTMSSGLRGAALAQAQPPGEGDDGRVEAHAAIGRTARRAGRPASGPRPRCRSPRAPTSRCAPRGARASGARRRPPWPATPGRAPRRRPPRAPTCRLGGDHDGRLVVGRLVADRQPADPVVHRGGDARRADGVERVHRRDEPEAVRCRHPAEARHVQLALAHHRDEHVERLLGDAVDLLDVQQRAVAHRRDQRTVDEHVGVVAVGEHARRVEVADEARRGELGVALDELEAEAELVGHGAQQRALAGARRTLQQDVPVGGQRGHDQLDLPLAPDHPAEHPLEQLAGFSHAR